MKLENKVAIITGGTKGIGYGIAEEYLKEGAKITICSRNAQEGVKAAKELGKLGEVLYLQADVSSIEDNQMLVDETVKKYGRLDIFVANAGINDPDKTHYLHITEEQYDRILGVNLKGPAGGKADGKAGAGRSHCQYFFCERLPGLGQPDVLYHQQGRSQPADQGTGCGSHSL